MESISKSVWAVTADDGTNNCVLGVFLTLEDARNFAKYCQNWKERFEKHFGIAYRDVKDFTVDMAEWFDSEFNNLNQILVIQKVKFYENGFCSSSASE